MPPTSPPSVPSLLLQHGRERAEEPWLFRPEGYDWRWHPFGEMAAWLSLDAAWALELPPGPAVPIAFQATPAWVALDLALQSAGRTSALGLEAEPLPAPLPPRPGAADSPHRGWKDVPPLDPGDSPGGVEVRTSEGSVQTWSADDISRRAEALGVEIERLGGPVMPKRQDSRPEREIVVWGGPASDPGRRALLAWATATGAVLLLEPNPGSVLASALWARPTVFQGTAPELTALRRALEGERPGRRRPPSLPLRRLRILHLLGDEGLSEGDEAFWRERGVALLDGIAAERRNRGI